MGMTYGTAGRLIIPGVGISVPLYYKNENKSNGQDIVDREDSALYKPKTKDGCAAFIGDHGSQGFSKIRKCKLSETAFIQTPTSTDVYFCSALTIDGKNTGKDHVLPSGVTASKCKWADLYLATCNDGTGKWITMVFFKCCTALRMNYPYFKEDPVTENEKHDEELVPESDGPVQISPTYIEVKAGCSCNIRSEPSTNGKILGILRNEEKLQYIGDSGIDGWHNVDYNGKSAYVSAKYTSLKL